MSSELASVAARGGAIVGAAQALRTLVQLGGLVVLGRLLPPEDFGIIAMTLAVLGIADVIRDLGLSAATVQTKKLSSGQASNLFWISSTVGVALSALAVGIAPLLAWLYQDQRIQPIAMALAISFALNGVQAQFQAHMSRHFRFLAVSLTDLSAMLVGIGVAVWLAIAGFGVWALVAQVLTQSAVLLVLRAACAGWWPGLPTRRASVKSMLGFGTYLSFTQILVYVSANIDTAVIGARFGPDVAGLYKRATQILLLPLNQLLAPLTGVALPVLSRLQDDLARLEQYLVRAQTVIGYVVCMLFGIAVPLAPALIPLVFGGQWSGTVPFFQVLALGGVFQALNYSSSWIFTSLGKTGQHLIYAIVSRSLLVVLVLAGSIRGPLWVAVAFSVSMVAAWPLCLWWARRATGMRTSLLAIASVPALLLGGVGALTGTCIDFLSMPLSPGIRAALVGAGSLAVMSLVALIVRPMRQDLLAIRHTIAAIRGPRTSGGVGGPE